MKPYNGDSLLDSPEFVARGNAFRAITLGRAYGVLQIMELPDGSFSVFDTGHQRCSRYRQRGHSLICVEGTDNVDYRLAIKILLDQEA